MGVRYQAIAKTDHGSKEYRVDLIDTLWVSDFNEIDLWHPGFTIKYLGDENDPLVPIIPSEINIIYKVDNAFDFNFFSNVLNMAQEDRFYIEVYEDGSILWRGVVQQDQLQWPDAAFPIEFNVKAVDGLVQLKTVKEEFVMEPGVIYQNLAGYLIDALNKITWTELLADTDFLLRTCIYWKENQMEAGSELLDCTFHIQPGLVYTEDGDGRKTYIDWFSVVEQIVKSVGGRLMMVKGIFYLYQPYNGTRTQPVTIKVYDKYYERRPTSTTIPDTFGLSSGTEDLTETLPETSNGLFSLSASLRRATLFRDITLGYVIAQTKNQDYVSTWFDFGPVFDNGNLNQIRFLIRQNLEVENTGTAANFGLDLQGEVKIVVGATTYYATATGWSTTPTTIVFGSYTTSIPAGAVTWYEVYRLKADFTTFALPGPGTMSIKIRAVFTTGSITNLSFSRNYTETLTVTYGNFIDNQNVRSEILNTTNPFSSLDWEEKDVYLGDNPNSFIKTGPGYMIWPTGATLGSSNNLKMAFAWTDTYFTSKPINYAQVVQRMALLNAPRYRWTGTVYDFIEMHKVYAYQSKNYMVLSMEFTAATLSATVVLQQLVVSTAGLSEIADPRNNLPST
jgi:hypothetical protein